MEIGSVVIKKENISTDRTTSPETFLNISPLDLSSTEYNDVAGLASDEYTRTSDVYSLPSKPKEDLKTKPSGKILYPVSYNYRVYFIFKIYIIECNML